MKQHVHFIGVGGSGLSAIARLLLELGWTVSGSDRVLSPLARELAEAGVRVYEGHASQNIQGADLVIRSSAVSDDNPEVVAARAAGIPVLKRADFLGELMSNKESIAIAGTHGKTTTTAMTAWVFTRLGKDPSYIIGGVSKNLGGNAHAGPGAQFVIEADEYDHMFLGLHPQRAIVTVVEHDHPDCFPTRQDYLTAFTQFAGSLRPGGTLFTCQDDPGARSLVASIPEGCRAFTYGLSREADYNANGLTPNSSGGMTFWLDHHARRLVQVNLQVPGVHNVKNAAGVLALAHQACLPLDEAARALAEFNGVGRRFETLGEANGIVVIDDYAHHPTEIRATLAAARLRYPGRRIWAVWQPHTYSRTQALLADFASAFENADRVLVTEIYAARENLTGFSAARVVEAMRHPAAVFAPTLAVASSTLLASAVPGDVIIVMSAGDADQVSVKVLAELKEKEHNHA